MVSTIPSVGPVPSPGQGQSACSVLPDGSYTRPTWGSFCCPALPAQRTHIRVEEPAGCSGARALHHFCISVNPLAGSPPVCCLASVPALGIAPGTGTDADVAELTRISQVLKVPAQATWTYVVGVWEYP